MNGCCGKWNAGSPKAGTNQWPNAHLWAALISATLPTKAHLLRRKKQNEIFLHPSLAHSPTSHPTRQGFFKVPLLLHHSRWGASNAIGTQKSPLPSPLAPLANQSQTFLSTSKGEDVTTDQAVVIEACVTTSRSDSLRKRGGQLAAQPLLTFVHLGVQSCCKTPPPPVLGQKLGLYPINENQHGLGKRMTNQDSGELGSNCSWGEVALLECISP